MQRTLAFRLCPTPRQASALLSQLEACRWLYNACLQQRRTAWSLGVKVPREYDQNLQLKEVRAALPEYAAVPSGVLQAVPKQVQRTYENYFRGDAGPPRFKGRARFARIVHLAPMSPHGHGTYRVEERRLVLTRVGRVRYRLGNRPPWLTPEAVPKTCTLKLVAGRWHARIGFEVDPIAKPSAPEGSAVGLDAGLAHLWTDDHGRHVDNPRWLQGSLRRLRRQQRSLSRRKKGSARRRRQSLLVARTHERIANQRRDFSHKLARTYARSFALVAVEDNLAGLGRGRLARRVHDAGWGLFRRLLEYKLAEHGGRLVKVDPRGTSKRCSGCGAVAAQEPGRTVRCGGCGLALDRDTNAARNILARALKPLEDTVPADGGEFTPGETGGALAAAQAAAEVPVEEPGTGFGPA